MHCTNCGSQLAANDKFCGKCGTKVEANAPVQNAADPKDSVAETVNPVEVNNSETSALEPATQGQRFANFILDGIGYLIFAFVIGFVLGLTGIAGSIDLEGLAGDIFGLILMLVYYIFFEAVYKKSPAKYLTKTKVVMKDGSEPSFKHIVGRSFARLIPFEPFSFLTKKASGWHDSLSGTMVVKDK